MFQRLQLVVLFLVICNDGNPTNVRICPGDHLMLSCNTNSSSLQWTVNISLSSGSQHFDTKESGIRLITRTGPESEQPIIANQTVFHISKTSSSPLISVISVYNVTTSLNQTKVECTYSGGKSVTTIHVIGNDHQIMIIASEQFGANRVTVTLEWAQSEVVFNNVLPPAVVKLIGNRSVQLIIPYNIKHNVSVAVCGQPFSEVTELYYIFDSVTCDDPMDVFNALTVANFTVLAIEGSNVNANLTCSHGLTLNILMTCIDGKWEPNPSQIIEICNGPESMTAAFDHHSTLIVTVIPVSVAIIVFFTFGFVCGCFCHKYKQSTLALCKTPVDQSSRSTDSKVKQQDSCNLGMTDNVAYGPLRRSQLPTT